MKARRKDRDFHRDLTSTVTLPPAEVRISNRTVGGGHAVRLDPLPEGLEFERADCAPRGTLGDGQLKVTDWVQVGRYVAGLDDPTPAGGPSVAASQLATIGLGQDDQPGLPPIGSATGGGARLGHLRRDAARTRALGGEVS